MPESTWIMELAKIGGPLVIVVGLMLAGFLLYMWKKDQMYNKTLNNHLAHETESRDNLTIAITSLTEVVRNCPKK